MLINPLWKLICHTPVYWGANIRTRIDLIRDLGFTMFTWNAKVYKVPLKDQEWDSIYLFNIEDLGDKIKT